MECYQRGVDAKAVSQVPDPPGLLGRQSSAVPPDSRDWTVDTYTATTKVFAASSAL